MSLAGRITRRGACGALGFAGLSRGAGAKTATAFALIGDEPHNSAYIRTGLTRTLIEGAGLSIDFTDQEKMLSYETLRQYKVFILFRDGYRWPNGRWRPVLSNDKTMITEQKDLVSVPPLPMKIGVGPVAWMTAEQGKAIKQWDIFFTNGAALPSLEKNSAKFHNRLFRNDGNWKFTDVTGQAGLAGAGYSMGAAAADFDNDGHPDLFIAGAYRNLLYRNRGDGTFEEIAGKSGINSKYWSVAAGWFDFDNDGLVDLFVVNYAKWTPAFDRFCGDASRQIRIYCHPKYFPPVPNQLYRNLGGGRFQEISDAVGLSRHPGRGMSVVFADYDGDGSEDVFVTNDKLENFLFHNRAGKSFEEVAVTAGVALPDDGRPISGMGADFRDYNNDGLPDLIVTALSGETFPLFQNLGKSQFRDATYSSKLASATRVYAGWSVGFADFDNDGWRDLFTANSHVNNLVEKFEPYVYRQPNTVFRNQHDGTFALTDSGMSLMKAAHRGSGFADFDGDGRVDIVVSALGGPAELWRNLSPAKGAWLDIRLVGKKSNRDGLGAQIRIGNQTNPMTSAAGYASSSLTPVHFGGLAETADVEIRWPSGFRQIVKGVATSRTVTIAEE